jgi:hypothetical protein
MTPTSRTGARLACLLAAGATAGAVLTGCGAAHPAAGGRPAAVPAASTQSAGADLSSGLLPESAFGQGASVMHLSPAQLQQALAMAGTLKTGLSGAQFDPPACGPALISVVGQLGGWTDAAAEGARTGGVLTGEVLASGGDADALLSQLDQVRTGCDGVTATVPGRGTATVTTTPLSGVNVPAGATAVSMTVDATGPDGARHSVPALVAIARDGGRVLALVQAAPQGGAPDPAGFAQLLMQAVQQQATLD